MEALLLASFQVMNDIIGLLFDGRNIYVVAALERQIDIRISL